MKRATAWAMPTANATRDFVNLTLLHIQAGQEMSHEGMAVLASFILSEPTLLATAEGRKLLGITKTKLRGSEWDEVVFPKPKTDEEKLREKRFQKMAKDMEQILPQYEEFFNQVDLTGKKEDA